jgi:hypothetical protein
LWPKPCSNWDPRPTRRATTSRVWPPDSSRSRREIRNLANALAVGGDVPSLVAALKAREVERETLRRRIASLGNVTAKTAAASVPNHLRALLVERLADWQGTLQRQAPIARQILKKLLEGPLRFTPREGFYEFEGEGTLAKMLACVTHPVWLRPQLSRVGTKLNGWLRAVDFLRRAA